MYIHKGPLPNVGVLSKKNGVIILEYFSTKHGTSMKSPKKWYRASIVQNAYYDKCAGKH
jgi:hypothetical protein